MDTEVIRKSYQPDTIRLLFVGESPPASGKFFYEKSLMTTYMSRAFERVFQRIFQDHSTFLVFFRDAGCYLDDLCPTPVNNLPPSERTAALEKSVLPFSIRLKEYQPDAVVSVMKKIRRHVEEAMRIAGLVCPFHPLPFPGNGHQKKFINELPAVLIRYIKQT